MHQYLARTALRALAVLSVLTAGLSNASADIIQTSVSGGAHQINYYQPIGQSFTAVDSLISTISFYIEDFNPSLNPGDHSLTVTLYAGGTGAGSVVASSTYNSIADGTNGFVDFDFSGVALNVGDVYSAMLTDDTSRWGVAYGWGANYGDDAYAGGSNILFGSVSAGDLAFKVLAPSTAVSSSGSLSLALLAGGLLALQRRRQSGGKQA